ncbi:tRNA glutamyl-Q(34) synthetase GluQRS [Hoeflea sp.]|uniref:tRNA glutamyl-Q(34) synthetase GluQRS n=1 Tax=Hoeflea sp. TaxID=1940281 RepID=UPI003B52288A
MHAATTTTNRNSARERVRFAPSPNGLLHLGHARSALLNWRFAKAREGLFLLRIEDIDVTRARPEFEQAICEDLDWLGIVWPDPPRRQSEHFDDYRRALEELKKLDLVYPAFMSRAEAAGHIREAEAGGKVWPRDPDGVPLYPRQDRNLGAAERRRRIESGDPHGWRLDMRAALAGLTAGLSWRETGAGPAGETGEIAATPDVWGDVILARRDVPSSYHLAVTVDDALQDITTVVRGHDLFAATSVHRLLQTILGLPAPNYLHHDLVRDETGRKLSKSDGDVSLASLRRKGFGPEDIARLAGL